MIGRDLGRRSGLAESEASEGLSWEPVHRRILNLELLCFPALISRGCGFCLLGKAGCLGTGRHK